jgi:hypothetical protein
VRKQGWLWTVIGALVPSAAVLAATRFPASDAKDTWAYPLTPNVFLGLSVTLAIAHFCVALGFDEIADRSGGASARSFAQLGALGILLGGACQIASGVLGRQDRDSDTIGQLNAGYGLATVLIIIGTLGAGIALRRIWVRVGLPLMVSGYFVLFAVSPAFVYSIVKGVDGPRIAALTAWSLLYVWLGLAMRKRVAPREPA